MLCEIVLSTSRRSTETDVGTEAARGAPRRAPQRIDVPIDRLVGRWADGSAQGWPVGRGHPWEGWPHIWAEPRVLTEVLCVLYAWLLPETAR